jgi:hypothetical protein
LPIETKHGKTCRKLCFDNSELFPPVVNFKRRAVNFKKVAVNSQNPTVKERFLTVNHQNPMVNKQILALKK